MNRKIAIGTVLLTILAAGPIFADFGASDLIYIPVVSHSSGALGSQWRTDVYITNVDDVAVDVAFVYLPSALLDNQWVFYSRDSWLGGRESDSFGLINEALADIPPNGTVVIRDIVGEYWASILGSNGNGSLIVAAYEADSLEDDGSRVHKNVIVNSRIYNKASQWEEDPDNEGEFLEKEAWYGQTMPGVPWYNFADGGAVGDDFDFSYEELSGGEEGTGLRFNVGFVNASDPQTTLTVGVKPYQSNGEPFLNADEDEIGSIVTMPPASHFQLFRPFRDEWDLGNVEDAMVRVSILAWSSTAAEPVVMLTSYGSVVANNTSDPSTVLPRFAYPYDVECMWNGGEAPLKGQRSTRRPVEIPSQN